MRNRICVAVAAALLVLVAGTAVKGQDLNKRIDALEKELADLRAQVERQDLQKEVDALKARFDEAGVSGGDFKVYWKDGLRIDMPSQDVELKIGGRIMNDWGFFSGDSDIEDEVGDLEDGAEFRRARLYISGTILKDYLFKAQYDFAGGDADFKDVYLGVQNVPYAGTLLVGHHKEPFSLEESTSSKYTTFMERALPNAFAPGRNTGFKFSNALGEKKAERLTYAAGIYREVDDTGDSDAEGSWGVTGRITGLPYYADKGRQLLHLGTGYSYRQYDEEDALRYRERPESHLLPRFVDTGSLDAEAANLLNFEAATVLGPFSLQGEYAWSFVDSRSGSDNSFQGGYVEASYFLTGEHRPYSTSSGAFSRVKPKQHFLGKDKGPGAWQVAARYSYLDLTDDEVEGGELENITLGLNWHLTSTIRVMFNYILMDLDLEDTDGTAQAFQSRFQIDF